MQLAKAEGDKAATAEATQAAARRLAAANFTSQKSTWAKELAKHGVADLPSLLETDTLDDIQEKAQQLMTIIVRQSVCTTALSTPGRQPKSAPVPDLCCRLTLTLYCTGSDRSHAGKGTGVGETEGGDQASTTVGCTGGRGSKKD